MLKILLRHRRLRLGIGAAALLVLGALAWHFLVPPSPPPPPTEAAPQPGLPWFVDCTNDAGIDFVHFDPATPHHYIQETIGSGLAWIDYDNDGWPDLFCAQAGPVRPTRGDDASPTCRLYRNRGDRTFRDVTVKAGVALRGFGQGCAVGDYDNDGFDDLVVTLLGGLVLYHNNGDGTLTDVTSRSGLKNPHWGTSCAWGDIDNDGFLDLYVCNYVEVDIDRYPDCETGTPPQRYICPPTVFPHAHHALFRNNHDGTFTDISRSSGIASVAPAPGLGVVLVDLDGDGLLDIYVANDMKPQYLFHNQGGGRFVEKGLLSGCALGPSGRPVAGMGVAAGDVDGSGRPSLFVTNFQNEPNLLYRNRGDLLFTESSTLSGLGIPSVSRLGFGTSLCDVDLDGRLDIAVANGHIHRNAQELYSAPFAQKAQLFLGDGKGRYRDVSPHAGAYFRADHVGRGLAASDFDRDGRPDLVFGHCGGPIVILQNRTETANSWLALELMGDGKRSNRNAIGARVEVWCGQSRQVRFLNGGGSYLSANERRLLVGLGENRTACRIKVRWPSGQEQEFPEVNVRHAWRLREGKPQAESLERR